MESATHDPDAFRNKTREDPGCQPLGAVPGNGTKSYVADPLVNENFTGKPDVVAGASETVSPWERKSRTADAFVIVTGVAPVARYAVFWSGTAHPRNNDAMMTARAMTRSIARIVPMISEIPLSLRVINLTKRVLFKKILASRRYGRGRHRVIHTGMI